MHISLRSQLLAGSAAVITAGAVAAGGVVMPPLALPAPHVLHVPTIADVQLAAFQNGNPFLEVFDTLQKANLYLFSIAEPPATEFERAGIFPDFLAGGFPIATQYALNASDYVNQVGNYLFADYNEGAEAPQPELPGAFRALAWAGQALPENLGIALRQTLSGQLFQAFDTLQFAVFSPLQYAAYQVLNLGLYELGTVAARAAAVVSAVAEWVPKTIRALADDVTVIGNAVALTIDFTLGQLQIGQPLGALAALVHGVLGTNGNGEVSKFFPTIPDALINQTIGEGGLIDTFPNPLVDPVYVEAPSIRQNLTELRDNLAEALATEAVVPEPPPFTIQGSFIDPLYSSIPTPWRPNPFIFTPVQSPVAAASVESTAIVSVEPPTLAATATDGNAAGSAPANRASAPAKRVAARDAVVAQSASAGNDDGAATNTPKRATRGAKKASSSSE